MVPQSQENMGESPNYNEISRLESRERIKNTILNFQNSKNRRLKQKLFKEILNYLLTHQDHTGGYETPFLNTAQEVAEWYGVTKRTIVRWKKKEGFPFKGKVFDCWAIDCWLMKHGKVAEDFRIIPSKKFSS
jgi:hypothetical protein